MKEQRQIDLGKLRHCDPAARFETRENVRPGVIAAMGLGVPPEQTFEQGRRPLGQSRRLLYREEASFHASTVECIDW